MNSRKRRTTPLLALLLATVFAASSATAQDRQAQRLAQGQCAPEDMVSFSADTSFPDFTLVFNLIAERATGKTILDPLQRTDPIGIEIQNMCFLDAMDVVLGFNDLGYRETASSYIIQPLDDQPDVVGADAAAGRERPIRRGPEIEPLATLDTREIQINAILFEVNQSRAREIGLDWGVFLDDNRRAAGGQGSQTRPRFFLNYQQVNESGRYVQTPNQIGFAQLNEFVRFAEQNGAGETIANPFTTVQSGQEGRIQIGTDIPVQTRDFSGNTLTRFFSTGIIVTVTPTLIEAPLADTVGAPTLPFVHLDIAVEKSGAVPSEIGVAIDRNSASTQVLLLDGEQTVIGGLHSTEETLSRSGIPLLKDLPPWFFGLRYLFGRTTRQTVEKELVIILQANVLQSIPMRAENMTAQDLLELRRQQTNTLRQSISRPPIEPPPPVIEQ